MKVANGFEVITLFEQMYPRSLAMEGDKNGLQIGTLNKQITGVLVTLDLTMAVVEEALEKNANLIIAHHPFVFMPLKHIQTDYQYGKIIEKCIKEDIAIYSAHTNVDIASGGVNDLLAEALGLQDTEVLVETYAESLKKLVVYVPKTHEALVRQAIGEAGAGAVGDYSHCVFRSEGIGAFMPNDQANPFIGESGKLEEVVEVRLETVFPSSKQRHILKAMKSAHPYEEPGYDVYPIESTGETYGLGRIGYLPEAMTLEQFAQVVKEKLDVTHVRVVGDLTDGVRKVAVLGGDGNKYFRSAKFAGADVYVTGDVYFHTAQDALLADLNMIDPGHHVEKVMRKGVSEQLQKKVTREKLDVAVYASEVDTNPFVVV